VKSSALFFIITILVSLLLAVLLVGDIGGGTVTPTTYRVAGKVYEPSQSYTTTHYNSKGGTSFGTAYSSERFILLIDDGSRVRSRSVSATTWADAKEGEEIVLMETVGRWTGWRY
jgi:hypothetical protein